MQKSKTLRLDNVGIVVQDLESSIEFFEELGFELEGKMPVSGKWVDRIVGLHDVRNDIAMLRTPDGKNRLELIKFNHPQVHPGKPHAPVNALGIRRIMFAVTNIDDVIRRLEKRGAKLIGEVVQYGDAYRLCYLRTPEGIIIALAEELSDEASSKQASLVRMDNVLIVVQDLERAKAFFKELGLELQGEPVVEGPPIDKLLGLENVHATLAVMNFPNGNCSIELDKFHSPKAMGHEDANSPVNTLGICRVMFAVTDIDDVVDRLKTHGVSLVGEVVQYENMYRLCYVRGPEGIIVALAEQIGS